MKRGSDTTVRLNTWNRIRKWLRIKPRRRFRRTRAAWRRFNRSKGREWREKAHQTSEQISERAAKELSELKADSLERYESARPGLIRRAKTVLRRVRHSCQIGVRWMRITASVIASTLVIVGIVVVAILLLRDNDADTTELSCDGCQKIDVIRIIDGDTLDTSFGRVRIYGADTPERGERCFDEATEEMRRLAGDEVRVEQGPRQMDVFDRNLFYLYTEAGTSIDELLVRNGFAEAWARDGQHRDFLVELENTARRGGVGCLWN